MNTLTKALPLDLARISAVRDNYTPHVKDFVSYVQAHSGKLSYDAVRAYFIDLKASTLSASTKRVRRQAVKARMRMSMIGLDWNQQARAEAQLRELDHDPATKAPEIQAAPVSVDKVLSRSDLDALVTGTTPRTRLFLWFLYNTACRIAEATGARLENCKTLDSGKVEIRITGKGDKERRVEIERGLFDDIREQFKGTVYLFETSNGKPFRNGYVSGEIAKAGKRILGRHISAHCLRHSWATVAIQDGEDLTAVSKYMGHSSISITAAMYVHTALKSKIRQPYRRTV